MPTGNKYQRPITARRFDAEAAISLLKRRPWFSNDGGTGDDPEDGGTGGNDPGGSGDDELTTLRAKAETDRVTIATLKRENMQKSQSVTSAESAAQEAEEARLIAIGEHETVIANLRAENESLKARAEIGDKAIETMAINNQVFIDSLPEQKRSIVPVALDTQALASWIERNRGDDSLSMPKAPEFDAGANGGQSGGTPRGNSGVALTKDQAEMALRLGMTNDEYAANLPTKKEG